jgi:hypothetical protein
MRALRRLDLFNVIPTHDTSTSIDCGESKPMRRAGRLWGGAGKSSGGTFAGCVVSSRFPPPPHCRSRGRAAPTNRRGVISQIWDLGPGHSSPSFVRMGVSRPKMTPGWPNHRFDAVCWSEADLATAMGGRFRAAKSRVDNHPDPVFTPAFVLCRGYRLNAP